MKARITKVIHQAKAPNFKGKWLVWVQVYVNGNYRYTALDFDTAEAMREIKEGMVVELDRL